MLLGALFPLSELCVSAVNESHRFRIDIPRTSAIIRKGPFRFWEIQGEHAFSTIETSE